MREINELIKDFSSDDENQIIERAKKRNEEIEYILRNKIKRPIKGKITKRKLRVRGITSIAYYKWEVIGVVQHGKVIGVNGEVEFPLKLSALRGMTSQPQRAEEIDKHYCPECYDYDNDDNLVLR